jgi:hypothetical protein
MNDHRLEAGGFDRRLKARLMMFPEKPNTTTSSAHATFNDFSAAASRRAQSDVLEVIAWKARVFWIPK